MLLDTKEVYMTHVAERILIKYALMSEYIDCLGAPSLSHAMLTYTIGDKYAEAVLFAYCAMVKRQYNINY